MAERNRTFDWDVLHRRTVEKQLPVPRTETRIGERRRPPGSPSSEPTANDWVHAAEHWLADTPAIALRVNDLKQYAYCPRIVFYQYTMPVQRKATFKMARGKAVESRVEQLERRRKLREYGLAEGERRFQVWLASPRLGLSGRLDLMIITPDGVFPVDFKDTRERVHRNHHVQLCAYALLVEDTLQRPVHTGFIYRVPHADLVPVAITAALRAETMEMMEDIRRMIHSERMLPPTSVRARCTDCEYRNYCGDIF
jgi:CRISPR-associated exonuclease Cas4